MSRGAGSYHQRVIEAFRAHGGVVDPGLDLLLFVTSARDQARERVTPLAYWRVDDTTVAVLASNRGAPKHPNWYRNLVANPDAKAEIGTETFVARARVASPSERSKLLPRIVARTPSVSGALNRTSREIPLVILDLRTDDGGLVAGKLTPPGTRPTRSQGASCDR